MSTVRKSKKLIVGVTYRPATFAKAEGRMVQNSGYSLEMQNCLLQEFIEVLWIQNY
jgi:hypothetical protein